MRQIILPAIIAVSLLSFGPISYVIGGDTVKATNLEKLNTAADEEDPCPSPDGSWLLYSVKTKKHYDFYISKKTMGATVFPAGKPFLAERGADVRSPFPFQGKYYYAFNEVPDEKFAKLKNFDLQVQTGTLAASFVQGDVNSKADEMYPWITSTGKEFYFSRKTEEGWKLFVANGPIPGPIGKSRLVGFPTGFHRAAISSAGLIMYLQGPLEDERIGIFKSKRAKIGAEWSKPEPVTALNHPDAKKGDMQPAISADGTRLYFSSDRPGGKGGMDIWVVLTSQLK